MNKAFSVLFLLAVFSSIRADEQMTIGIIDFYGLRSLTEEQVRAALIEMLDEVLAAVNE